MNIFSKLPGFLGGKRRKKGRKMRANVGRRSLRAATADYEEMGEPNMKLSRALLIVLLLHVVAVSGIIAFNAIKTRQAASVPRLKNSATPVSLNRESNSGNAEAGVPKTASMEIRPARAVKPNDKTDSSRRDAAHKTYTVAKGDNPVSIAKKFKVSYDDLLALNHIDDPRKLKIGQKLLIPNKASKGKRADE
ncbi:MAG TPA: LysM domain-containing protein [Chthoniobacterales bacterium]|nr:LysM domain-containing protein [Chthoniobacterales bacterium]